MEWCAISATHALRLGGLLGNAPLVGHISVQIVLLDVLNATPSALPAPPARLVLLLLGPAPPAKLELLTDLHRMLTYAYMVVE